MTFADRQVDHLWAVYTTRRNDIMITDALKPHEFCKWHNKQDWGEGRWLKGVYTTEDAAGQACKRIHKEWYE